LKIILPKIYPITDTSISRLSHLEQVTRLIAGGASFIQLREKSAAAGEFCRAASEAIDYAHRHGAKIIINDRVDIALAAGADGVHLGQDDLSPIHARSLLGPAAIIGYSTHSVEQATEALRLPIDYLAIGPIFATSTKSDPDPVVGLGGLRAVRELAPDNAIVAIGGIHTSNAGSVLAAGADCVAAISAVLAEPSQISARMQQLMNL
jgi:thiamine-phosphate pyrophosphorylase